MQGAHLTGLCRGVPTRALATPIRRLTMNLLVLTLAAGITATTTAGQSVIDLQFEARLF